MRSMSHVRSSNSWSPLHEAVLGKGDQHTEKKKTKNMCFSLKMARPSVNEGLGARNRLERRPSSSQSTK